MLTPYKINEIKLELSYRCHLNCIHCSSEGNKDNSIKMTLDESLNILQSAENMGVKTISLSGGEPFLWPSIGELFNKCLDLSFNIKIYTSGSTHNFKNILSKIKKTNLKIIFSVYGSSEDVHDSVTKRKGSYKKTLSAINYSVNQGFDSEIHFVPLNINYKELIPVTEFAAKLNIKNVSILRFVPQGRGSGNNELLLSHGQYLEIKSDILSLRRSGYNIRTGSPLNFLLLDDQPDCTSGMTKLIIAPDLSIYPCDAFKQIKSEDIVGYDEHSSLKRQTLEDCWNKSKYLNKIRQLNNISFEEPCLSCPYLKKCRSGCLAQKMIYDSSLIYKCDPSCLLN
jgi:radical SAM protein with 4Fe4S-binding SPASM domain